MLTMKEFANQMKEQIKNYMPPQKRDVECQVKMMIQNNNTQRVGLLFQNIDSSLDIVIYAKEFYKEFQKGKNLEEIIPKVVERYLEVVSKEKELPEVGEDDYASLKEQITMKLVNERANRELLEQAPHRKIEDLALVYQVVFQMAEQEEMGSFIITNGVMEKWEMNEQEIYEVAMRNTKEVSKPVFTSMTFMMEALVREEEPVNLFQDKKAIPEKMNEEMFVLTNETKEYGATMMIYPEILSEISEMLQGEYYLLPSSLHEMIIVSKDANVSPKELGKMVREINKEQVEPEEWLSDRVYKYDKETKQFHQAMESIERSKERER
jgi:hypothetical protein